MGLLVINIGKMRRGEWQRLKRGGGMGNKFIGLETEGSGEWVGVHH